MLPMMPFAATVRAAPSCVRRRMADRGIVVFGVVSGLLAATVVMLTTIVATL